MRPVAVNFSRPRADLYPIVFIPAGMRPGGDIGDLENKIISRPCMASC
jgi:hypothetical protein